MPRPNESDPGPEPGALTPVSVAAHISGITTGTILDAVAEGTVRADRLGRKLYVDLDDVLRLAGWPASAADDDRDRDRTAEAENPASDRGERHGADDPL